MLERMRRIEIRRCVVPGGSARREPGGMLPRAVVEDGPRFLGAGGHEEPGCPIGRRPCGRGLQVGLVEAGVVEDRSHDRPVNRQPRVARAGDGEVLRRKVGSELQGNLRLERLDGGSVEERAFDVSEADEQVSVAIYQAAGERVG